MDANQNRERIKTKIAGRKVAMMRPLPEQFLAITMAMDENIPEMARYGAFTKMFTSLMPDVDDKVWFMEQLAMGNYTLPDLVQTLKRIATAPVPHGKPEPVKLVPLGDVNPDDEDDEDDY